MKNVLWVIAAVLIVLGGLFTLQGLGIVGGSGMTGDRTWAVIGPVMVVIGLGLGLFAVRRGNRST
jgi:hypothetical protein